MTLLVITNLILSGPAVASLQLGVVVVVLGSKLRSLRMPEYSDFNIAASHNKSTLYQYLACVSHKFPKVLGLRVVELGTPH